MKKLLGFIAIISTALAIMLALPLTGCGDIPADYVEYEISLVSQGGMPVRNATINLVGGENEYDPVTTDDKGYAKIVAKQGEYDIEITDLPIGYYLDERREYKIEGSETSFTYILQTKVITEQAIPAGKSYRIGDVMYDFTVSDYKGNTYTLSELLDEDIGAKKMVMLNFWGTWCGSCISEMPVISSAYNDFSQDIEVIALAILSGGDTTASVKEFAEKNSTYKFVMGLDSTNLYDRFKPAANQTGVPQTVIIDRYGVVCVSEVGAVTDVSQWRSEFTKFCADDYSADIEIGDETENNGGEVYVPLKPDVEAPASSEIENAINTSSYNFSYYFDEDEYNWPWLVSEDGKSVYAGNKARYDNKLQYSYAIMYSDFTAKKGDVLTFDYDIRTSRYGGYASTTNYLAVMIDGNLATRLSGVVKSTCYSYIVPADGTFTLALIYYKNGGDVEDNENVSVSNMRLISEADVANITDSADVKCFATNVRNQNYTDGKDDVRKYVDYVSYVYNEDDGYYHVESKNGPLLLVDVLFTTRWSSEYSVWVYASAGYCIFDGADLNADFEEIARLATYSDTETVPVDSYTKMILEYFTSIDDGYSYEDEWLELCEYYVHLGVGESEINDPINGLSMQSARPIGLGTTHVIVNKAPLPRGMYYKFVAPADGVYVIESVISEEDLATCDPIAWIRYADGSFLNNGSEGGNFRFTVRLNKDQAIYLLCAMFAHPDTGEYDVRITSNNAITQELKPATNGYTYIGEDEEDLTNGLAYVNGIETRLDDDGKYRHVTANDSLGSYVYIDLTHPTCVMGTTTLKDIIEGGHFDFTQYGGEDYTAVMQGYLDNVYTSGELEGMVIADEIIGEIIDAFIAIYDGDDYVDNTWLFTAYYYEYI